MSRFVRPICGAAIILAGCSTEFSPEPCKLDEDCSRGLVCELDGTSPVCVRAEEVPLLIGQSAPISGTNQALGTEMKLGIDLAFTESNATGGIRGRSLKLQFRDDAYQPDLAEAAVRALVQATPLPPTTPARCPSLALPALERGPNSVIAFLGNVGTPTMERAAPIAIQTGTLFFGAFTGAATILRDTKAADCGRYIFNVRASYAQEARATLAYFQSKGIVDQQHLISFDQSDSFGQAGYDGLVQASKMLFAPNADAAGPIARFRYVRNDDLSVPAQAMAATSYLNGLLSGDRENHAVGIMMTSTYGASAEFIKAIRTWQYASDPQNLGKAERLKLYFSNVSFVGPNALAARLVSAGSLPSPTGPKPYTENVVVSQVVPNYQDDSSELVKNYNRLIASSGNVPSFTSLEGYIAARVFIAGLLAHKGPFTPESLIATFESLPSLSLGVGATSGFSRSSHQYSDTVWGTAIGADGSFSNLYVWSTSVPIEFFE